MSEYHNDRTDVTTGNLRIEGAWENKRNKTSGDLFERIIIEATGASKVIIAHHLTYVAEGFGTDEDGRQYPIEVVEELPSADTLIFDHVIARKIWGVRWREMLKELALEPVETRDALLARLYNGRK